MADQTYKGNGEHQWEIVTGDNISAGTQRLRVPGGWLYRDRPHYSMTAAMVFVPMPAVVKHAV